MTILITHKEPTSSVSGQETLPALPLVAEEREKARQRLTLGDHTEIYLQLPRGSILHPGDILFTLDAKAVARVEARPEPVYTLRAAEPFFLMRAAYHLGNRHVAMEISPEYLRIKPDHVLAHLIAHLGDLDLVEETAPFVPDAGAYRSHGHTHA